MKTFFVLMCMFVIGCGNPDHEKERKDACEHSEGFAAGNCNAGDDFSPLTCLEAMDQFEGWWRGDAQTAVNHCLTSSACYAQADNTPGPSIVVPLQLCLGTELIDSLQPTNSETQAVSRFCTKAEQCGELAGYTVSNCEEILLNPYDDGQLFLMMSDQVSVNVANCDKSACVDFDNCVLTGLHLSGAFNSINGANVKMPKLMNIK
jgi:hypothetical protein